jgi:hypothetical protein
MNVATPLDTAGIVLDGESMALEELSIPALTREIALQQRPNSLLVKMMNTLEAKRQKKGLGWSRAWNKYGLNVFRTHISQRENDTAYLAPVLDFVQSFLGPSDIAQASFVKELLADPNLMAFTFYHNSERDGCQYEGCTLSLGRKRPEDKTKRDRLDIILEDERIGGRVDGVVDSLRIFVCPWFMYQHKEFHLVDVCDFSDDDHLACQDMYDHCTKHYHVWKGMEERQWSHWSVKYIDYFGPRSFIPQGSAFT